MCHYTISEFEDEQRTVHLDPYSLVIPTRFVHSHNREFDIARKMCTQNFIQRRLQKAFDILNAEHDTLHRGNVDRIGSVRYDLEWGWSLQTRVKKLRFKLAGNSEDVVPSI